MKLMEGRRRRRLAREAAKWTTTLDRGDSQDEALFNTWWSKSWRHMKAAMDMAAIDGEITRALRRMPEESIVVARSRLPNSGMRWSLVTCAAAVALVTVLAAVSVAYGLRTKSTQYETGIGELRIVRLTDGTSVHINTRSRLAVRFTEATRFVELIEGEALFDVGRDARPFEVRSGSTRIRDIGTRFNVRLSPEAVDVAVLAGEVQIEAKASAVALTPGETAHIEVGGVAPVRTTKVPIAALEDKISWTRGILAFTAQPLYDVVAEVNRYNTQQLAVADPATGNILIGGHFRADDLPALLRGFEKLGIRSVRRTSGEEDGTIALKLDASNVPRRRH
jgi:transmembrane sensor